MSPATVTLLGLAAALAGVLALYQGHIPGSILATFAWSVHLDGSVVAEDTRSFTRPLDAAEQLREEFEVYSDDYHVYSVRLRVARQTAHLDLLAAFRRPRMD